MTDTDSKDVGPIKRLWHVAAILHFPDSKQKLFMIVTCAWSKEEAVGILFRTVKQDYQNAAIDCYTVPDIAPRVEGLQLD